MDLLIEPEDGVSIDFPDCVNPIKVQILRDRSEPLKLQGTMTVYGFVVDGNVRVEAGPLNLQLGSGGYFSFPCPSDGKRPATVQANGFLVLIHFDGFQGQIVAGAIERLGRLSYIDGCSDSLLVYPPRIGDPCLNHLHLPAGTDQTAHTHPSIRIGVIAGGNGEAHGRSGETGEEWSKSLERGSVFIIREQEVHAFRTDKTGVPLDVIAFHPDSDWGPTDTNHPMVNRTILPERTAKQS